MSYAHFIPSVMAVSIHIKQKSLISDFTHSQSKVIYDSVSNEYEFQPENLKSVNPLKNTFLRTLLIVHITIYTEEKLS